MVEHARDHRFGVVEGVGVKAGSTVDFEVLPEGGDVSPVVHVG